MADIMPVANSEKYRQMVDSGEYREIPEMIAAPIIVDGDLSEPCWSPLKIREFYFDTENKTSHVPAFHFVRDSKYLYLGARYDLGGKVTLEHLKGNVLYFKLTLNSLLGDTDRQATVYFRPVDDAGNPDGKASVECAKCRELENYRYASKIEGESWSIEFSIPIDEVMAKDDRYLFYRIQFRNTLIPQQSDFSFFPTVRFGHTKSGRQLITGGYRNYLAIMR